MDAAGVGPAMLGIGDRGHLLVALAPAVDLLAQEYALGRGA